MSSSTAKIKMLFIHHSPLVAILILSLALNLWGITWDGFERWHPDEVLVVAEGMAHFKTLDHQFYSYGALPYYQVIAAAIIPPYLLNQLFQLWDQDTLTTITITSARALSVLFGTGIVLITYLLGRTLFTTRAALIAASFTAVSMGLVNIAHFATTDIPTLFWFMLSALMSAQVLRERRGKWYILAGLFAGLAAAVRSIGGLALLVLFVAHFASIAKKPKQRSITAQYPLSSGVLTSLIAFIIGNAPAAFNFCQWIWGFLQEHTFIAVYAPENSRAFRSLITNLSSALGQPLFWLVITSFAYSVSHYLIKPRDRRAILLIWAMSIPYYLIIGRSNLSFMHYAVPLIPPLLLLVGHFADDILAELSHLNRRLGYVVLLAVFTYSLLYTAAANLEFTNDARLAARQWLLTEASPNTTIEFTSYVARLPDNNFHLIQRPHNNKVTQDVEKIASNRVYHLLSAAITPVTTVLRSNQMCSNSIAYTPWFERTAERRKGQLASFDIGISGLAERQPDYLVTSSLYLDRFTRDTTSREGQLYHALFANQTDYQLVQKFDYQLHSLLDPPVEFVNPTVYIFKRTAGQTASSYKSGKS